MKNLSNKNKKAKNNATGITLIALVVTIVILLILAGVSINLVIGQNGLISKAKEAVTAYEQDQINTEIAMNSLYDALVEYLGSNSVGTTTPPATSFSGVKDGLLYYNDELLNGYLLYMVTDNKFSLTQSPDENLYYCSEEEYTGDLTNPDYAIPVSRYYDGVIDSGLNIIDNKVYYWGSLFTGAYISQISSTNGLFRVDLGLKYNLFLSTWYNSAGFFQGMSETSVTPGADAGYLHVLQVDSSNVMQVISMSAYSKDAYFLKDGEPFTGSCNAYEGSTNVVNGLAVDNISLVACLLPTTEIEVIEEDENGNKKRKKKKIKDIKVGDKVVSINPITGELEEDTVIFADGEENNVHTEYEEWEFSDGTILQTVHRHRFYNIEKQDFTYMDEWNIGEHGYTINGEKVELISHKVIINVVSHCTIFTEKWNNYFANGMLTGNRNSDKIKL